MLTALNFLASPIGRILLIGAALVGAYLYADHRGYQRGQERCRADWQASVERARAAVKADDKKASDDAIRIAQDEAARLAADLKSRMEMYDALAAEKDALADACTVSGDDARRLQSSGRR